MYQNWTTMKNSSRKNKGSRFENFLVDLFRERVDAATHRNYASGAGLDKSDLIIPSHGIEVEAKNSQTIHLIKDWEQTKRQNTGQNISVLAIRNPKKPEFDETLIVMEISDFIDLLNGLKDTENIETSKDNDFKWAVKGLKEAAQKVLSKFND